MDAHDLEEHFYSGVYQTDIRDLNVRRQPIELIPIQPSSNAMTMFTPRHPTRWTCATRGWVQWKCTFFSLIPHQVRTVSQQLQTRSSAIVSSTCTCSLGLMHPLLVVFATPKSAYVGFIDDIFVSLISRVSPSSILTHSVTIDIDFDCCSCNSLRHCYRHPPPVLHTERSIPTPSFLACHNHATHTVLVTRTSCAGA